MTAKLFTPTRVGAIEVANRLVMAPLTRNRAPHAIPTPLMAQYYAQRADPVTGAGLIVSEATAISPQGQGYADVPGLYGTEQLDGWKQVTEAVPAAWCSCMRSAIQRSSWPCASGNWPAWTPWRSISSKLCPVRIRGVIKG